MTGPELTDKQALFVEHYLRCFNATEAARLAKYQGSEATLGAVGYENLQKPQIRQRIKERLSAEVMITDEVLRRLSEQARGVYSEYIRVSEEGTPYVDVRQMVADGKGHLIKGVKGTKYGTVIEFYDVQAALALVARTQGLFIDKIAPTDPSGEHEYSGGGLSDEAQNRALATLAGALAARLSDLGADGAGDLGATEPAPVAGLPE